MSTEPYRWHYDYTRMVWDTGFTFNSHKSLKAFDRNTIALLDIERIIRERDIGIVEHYIQNIVEFTLDSEEARILDPTFCKLFRLSQLAVEYLNYCKKYLDTTTDTLKKELQKALEENDDVKHDIGKYEVEISKLRKKIKDLKSTLHIYQKFQPFSTTSATPGIFRCNECRKGFISAEYLKKHFLKRHPDSSELENIDIKLDTPKEDVPINTTPVHNQYKTETDRLQMEIKELKEKLNNTERFFQSKVETSSPSVELVAVNKESKIQSEEYYKHVEELHHQFELLKVQIESEMQLLKSQKVEQDKYKEWMETFFHKLDEKKERETETMKISETNQTASIDSKKDGNILEKSGQTNEKSNEDVPETKEQKSNKKDEIVILSEGEISASPTKTEKSNISNKSTASDSSREVINIEKLKEEMEKELQEKTKENIEMLGKQISEKMTNTFDILQERLETFWNKLQEIEIDRQKQEQLIIYKSPPTEFISSKKEDETINISKILTSPTKNKNIEVQEKSIHQTLDDDSETGSSKNEKITDIPKTSSVLKAIQKNDKLARNLIEELKIKVQENHIPEVKPKESKKPIIVQEPTVQQIYSKRVKQETTTEESETESETETESESESEPSVPIIERSLKVSGKSQGIKKDRFTTHTTERGRSTTQAIKFGKPITQITEGGRSTTQITEAGRPTTQTTEGGRSTATGVSTLKNRSITSLQNALRSNPDIFTQLRNDVKDIVANRLQNLGINPEWTRIPDKTYKQNSEIVVYHRTLAAKSTKNFMDIRESILENLNEQINDLKSNESRNITPDIEHRQSRFKSMFLNMREKAKSIIKSEKNLPSTPIYKLTVYKQHSSPNMKQSSEKLKSSFTRTKSLDIKNIQSKDSISAHKMYDTDTDEDTEINDNFVSPIKAKTKITQLGIRKSKSESSMEVVEFSDQGSDQQKPRNINNLGQSLDSIVEIKRELANQKEMIPFPNSGDITDTKSEVIAVSPREIVNKSNDKNLIEKTIENDKNKLEISSSEVDSDELKDEEKFQKSVLKNIASSSAAVKKKVLFDLHSGNKTDSEIKEQKSDDKTEKKPAKKTVKSNSFFKDNDWNDSTSIESSILEPNKTSKILKGKSDIISTKAVINISTKQNQAQADISDWDISDIN